MVRKGLAVKRRRPWNINVAAAKVSNIPELLEAILLHLPTKKVFVLRQVSKSWKTLIENSIRLKRMMFLAPEGSVIPPERQIKAHGYPWYDGETYLLAPLMPSQTFMLEPIFTYYFHPPSIDFSISRFPAWIFDDEEYISANDIVHGFNWRFSSVDGVTFPRGCQSMLLTQPPVAAILLWISTTSYLNPHRSNKLTTTLYNPAGITLGMIEWACSQMLKQLPTEHRSKIVYHGEDSPGLHGIFMMESSKVLLERRTEISNLEDDKEFIIPRDNGEPYVRLDSYGNVEYDEVREFYEAEEGDSADYGDF